MPRKIYKPEEIIARLRQVEILTSQGKAAVDAIRSIGVTDATYYLDGRLSVPFPILQPRSAGGASDSRRLTSAFLGRLRQRGGQREGGEGIPLQQISAIEPRVMACSFHEDICLDVSMRNDIIIAHSLWRLI